ncbi:MAG: hypothetical protein ACU0BF_08145 [Paracoccaceae bacterium]
MIRAAVLLGLLAGPAAAELGLTLRADGPHLFVSGEIVSDSPARMAAALDAAPKVTTLVLCAIPGSWDDEALLVLGRQVRARGLSTHVPSHGWIASGGVDLHHAGTRRTIADGASFGVHSFEVAGKDVADLPADHSAHAPFRAYLAQMIGRPDFYDWTIRQAPPDDLHWLSQDEIARFDLLTAPSLPWDSGPICPQDMRE